MMPQSQPRLNTPYGCGKKILRVNIGLSKGIQLTITHPNHRQGTTDIP